VFCEENDLTIKVTGLQGATTLSEPFNVSLTVDCVNYVSMPAMKPMYQEIIQKNQLTFEKGDPRTIEGKVII
jgi:hypothetical protein